MQFVQIKPCNLYQTAQEQLKKAEEVKKIKEIRKEEPEDWQNVSTITVIIIIFNGSTCIHICTYICKQFKFCSSVCMILQSGFEV